MIQYIYRINEYSFIYKTRKKEKSHREEKFAHAFYKYSGVYRLLCAIGRVFNSLFHSINKICVSSVIIKSIGSVAGDMKHRRLRVFNQFRLSCIIGSLITNSVINMCAAYKLKNVVAFLLLTILVNVMAYLVSKYKQTSLVVWLLHKVMN